jgi:hypothetical protein
VGHPDTGALTATGFFAHPNAKIRAVVANTNKNRRGLIIDLPFRQN